jgi:hypothetical protein
VIIREKIPETMNKTGEIHETSWKKEDLKERKSP